MRTSLPRNEISEAQVTTNLTGGASVPLDFLTTGNEAQVGDKLFNAFTFIKSGDFPVNFGADDINVIGIQDGSGNFGIRFQGGISPNLGGSGDIFLTYTVLVLAPNTFISDLHLAYTGGVVSAVIEQAFADGNPNPVAHLEVSNPSPVFDAQANVTPPQVQLHIEKDIFVRSLTEEPATIFYIDQTFSQVPEPSTITLLLAGLLGILTLARRRCFARTPR